MLRKTTILGLLLALGLSWANFVLAINSSMPKIDNPFDKLQVSIPGMDRFADAQVTIDPTNPEDFTISSSWIAEYIVGIYNFGILIIGIFAAVTFIIGAVMWITAAGSPARIGEAKSWIGSSIMGLLLGLSSYLILYTISPELVKYPSITLQRISPMADALTEADDQEEAEGAGSSSNGSYPAVNGQCFPMAKGSYLKNTWGFGDRRSGGGRCHAGIDIYNHGAQGGPSEALAIADGKVVGVQHFIDCGRCDTNAILIDHGSYVALYGEIDKTTISVKKGDEIKAGQILGLARCCSSGGDTMLHFELYAPGVTHNLHWLPPAGSTVPKDKNYCREHYQNTKPDKLLDPTSTLKALEGKMCGN